jgi:hypothetical protein
LQEGTIGVAANVVLDKPKGIRMQLSAEKSTMFGRVEVPGIVPCSGNALATVQLSAGRRECDRSKRDVLDRQGVYSSA